MEFVLKEPNPYTPPKAQDEQLELKQQKANNPPPRRHRPLIDLDFSSNPLLMTGILMWISSLIIKAFNDPLATYINQRVLFGITGSLAFVGAAIMFFCFVRFVLRFLTDKFGK